MCHRPNDGTFRLLYLDVFKYQTDSSSTEARNVDVANTPLQADNRKQTAYSKHKTIARGKGRKRQEKRGHQESSLTLQSEDSCVCNTPKALTARAHLLTSLFAKPRMS
jgi:hypothetical protein